VIQRELGTQPAELRRRRAGRDARGPHIILVGELRDADTIRMAMTAAETGHLVFGRCTRPAPSRRSTAVIDALPIEEREQTKSFLAQSLIAVITQILVKTADGRGARRSAK